MNAFHNLSQRVLPGEMLNCNIKSLTALCFSVGLYNLEGGVSFEVKEVGH